VATEHLADREVGASVTGLEPAWHRSIVALGRERWISAWLYAAAWTLFGLAFIGAIAVVALVLHSSPGSLLLVLAACGSLARYLGATLGTARFLRWTLDAAARLAWLEDFAAEHRDAADVPPPYRIARGIRFEGRTERLVLQDVNLDLPAGSVVAAVGENGAGKTTLVKLLCRFYEPSEGRITVDNNGRHDRLARQVAQADPAPRADLEPHEARFQPMTRLRFHEMRAKIPGQRSAPGRTGDYRRGRLSDPARIARPVLELTWVRSGNGSHMPLPRLAWGARPIAS